MNNSDLLANSVMLLTHTRQPIPDQSFVNIDMDDQSSLGNTSYVVNTIAPDHKVFHF